MRYTYIAAVITAVFIIKGFQGLYGSESSISRSRMEDALKSLDNNFNRRDEFLNKRAQSIVSLSNNLNLTELGRYESIGLAYIQYDNDSAAVYLRKALDIATEAGDKWRLTSRLAAVLPEAGFIQQSMDLYNTIPVDSLDRAGKVEYYENGRRMYSLITAFYSYYPDEAMKYSQAVIWSHEKLLENLDDQKDTPEYRANYGEYKLRTGEHVQAETLLREVYDAEPTGSALRTRTAHILAHLAHARNDVNSEVYYLVEAVNNDLVTGLRELPSLHDLALLCYKHEDVDHAYSYLNIALQDGVEAKSLMRMVQTSRSLPLIVEAHDKEVKSLSTKLYITVGILALAFVVLSVMLFKRYRKVKQMHSMQSRLIEANRIKEVYISQFLSLCSIYMDKLSQFGKTVSRKLSAGKADEVLRMTKNGKYLDEQNKDFYDTFDDAFLHIYPDFVAKVNELLQPDAQIELKEDEKMNTDLRILAFMRLGIDDSAKIARILNYSLNTIYTYRNKLKTRAVNRDSFEQDIMNIPSL